MLVSHDLQGVCEKEFEKWEKYKCLKSWGTRMSRRHLEKSEARGCLIMETPWRLLTKWESQNYVRKFETRGNLKTETRWRLEGISKGSPKFWSTRVSQPWDAWASHKIRWVSQRYIYYFESRECLENETSWRLVNDMGVSKVYWKFKRTWVSQIETWWYLLISRASYILRGV